MRPFKNLFRLSQKVITKKSNPRKTWGDLKKNYPEVDCNLVAINFQDDYKFTGQGQRKSPIINAIGAITIINLLPGQLAASFRAEWSSIIVRYFGDRTLSGESSDNIRNSTEFTGLQFCCTRSSASTPFK